MSRQDETKLRGLMQQAAALLQRGALDQAALLYQEVLTAAPANFAALHMLGVIRAQQNRGDEALALIGAALNIQPRDAGALVNYGNVLNMTGRFAQALASYGQALAVAPNDGDALYSQGNILCMLERHDEAVPVFEKLLALEPRHAGAHNNLGVALWALGQFAAALARHDMALAIAPDFVAALNNRGNALTKLRRFDDALSSYERSLAILPEQPTTSESRAGLLLRLKRYAQARAAYQGLLTADPAHRYALGGVMTAAMNLCDWNTLAEIRPQVEAGIAQGTAVIPPYMFLAFSDDPVLQQACGRNAVTDKVREQPASLATARHGRERIRIAYLSSDFCQHPVPLLIVRLIEQHDRSRFEVLGLSTGLDDNSAIRKRIEKAFDSFHDMRAGTSRAVAQQIAALDIDILIDLNGHTEGDSFEILSHRPAPVQVSYLGYPATTGAPFMDYILADNIVATAADTFSERVVQLRDSYFATSYDWNGGTPTRAEVGLPQTGFVFCGFNNSFKITAALFDVWMRLLTAVPGSVLWLLAANADFQANLAREAQARGVDPTRLIFAPRADADAHMARLGCADLMLDTAPFNGHTTTADALWRGVPLVTVPGRSFSSRVAASLLMAMEMPELITENLQTYEALALELAHDPAKLPALRAKMARNRDTTALFDSDRLRRNVEAAYTAMLDQSHT